ncbi:MAG: chromosomal replication initiator protein DnaA [Candidatus Omnitrophica bacterium]|jgi:chromosomal replication initiator protein|nr:chromosomal replication initiator protein DnaA [Candidatus Omnitrophota bacterium]MDD3987627.1 chromosomal replication initiator protein DnaA [Candidatus Omnitrophota bacterium]MDD4981387.1 chromosomal replication initiator protein DnaA [Candidatus Omnitrophota bacterium]
MHDLIIAWEQARNTLKERLEAIVYETWILPLKAKVTSPGSIVLEAPDTFFRDWVQKNYGSVLEEAIKSHSSPATTVTVEAAQQQAAAIEIRQPHVFTQEVDNQYGVRLNSRYTFENFVIGTSNRHAHAYSMAVSEAPAKAYNPLFIYGGVGLGKTHLIQAICHKIKANASAKLKITYLPSEQFTNELINAIQRHSTMAFRQKYRNSDILVIDDVHFFGGKDSTQEEFFHTFNALYDAHKQIILSSDRPPKEIADLQERLVSRFGWGLTTDVQPPDLETRVAILKKKIEREPVVVPDDVIFFIAQLIKTNIRELEGALVRTMAYSLMEEKPITIELAKDVLRDLLKEPKKLITIDFIQRCTAEEFGVSLGDLKTRRRNKTIVLPRQVAMYLSRELTDLSLPEVGQFFGGKDHTTVLHSYNKIKEEINKNPSLHEKVERIIHIIKQ